jgi:hypothetical protein
MERARKQDYFTGIYTSIPYQDSTINANRSRRAEQRREFEQRHKLIETSLNKSKRRESQLTFSGPVSEYRARRQSDQRATQEINAAIKAICKNNTSFRERREEQHARCQKMVEGEQRMRTRLDQASARARTALTCVRRH